MMLGHHERASRVKTYSHDLLSDIRLSPGIHVAKIRWWLGWQVDDFLYINSPAILCGQFCLGSSVSCTRSSLQVGINERQDGRIHDIWHHMTSYDIYVHLEVIWCWLVRSSNCCLSSWVTAGTAGIAGYLHLFVCLDGSDGSLRGWR